MIYTTAPSDNHRITFRLKILSDQLAQADIVVNYEDAFHWLLLSEIE